MNNIEWILGKMTKEEREELIRLATEEEKKKLKICNDGETFDIAGIEFIKFPDKDGSFVAVSKDILFNSEFGNDNNFSTSKVLEKLEKDILPKIEEEIGFENVLEISTDLTTLDGLKPYENLISKISIPTFDFYRNNVDVFDKYKIDEWWWLATPNSAESHASNNCVVCVSPRGDIDNYGYNHSDGVRPFLRFLSSIFESCED